MDESPELKTLLDKLPQYRDALRGLREIMLANAVMFGEIPAPTFAEEQRIRFLQDRFVESDLQNISTDELGNGIGILPGRTGERNILVSAHADTLYDASVDHTMSVEADRITGPGIADNALGLATVASLPVALDRLGIELDSNLILLGATRSLGRGDLAGLRFFLENSKIPVHAAVCVEGVHLGRLSYSCQGMLRAEITCTAPDRGDWQTGGDNAISAINQVITGLLAIRLPQQPKTSIILGSLSAGKGFTKTPLSATLRLEIRSDQAGMVGELLDELELIVGEISAETGVQANLQVFARRKPGGIGFDHRLVQSTRAIMQHLDIQPRIAPSVGDLSAVIAQGVPGITLGMTRGFSKNPGPESIEIEPMFSGIAQLIGVLQSIDQGVCDDDED